MPIVKWRGEKLCKEHKSFQSFQSLESVSVVKLTENSADWLAKRFWKQMEVHRL